MIVCEPLISSPSNLFSFSQPQKTPTTTPSISNTTGEGLVVVELKGKGGRRSSLPPSQLSLVVPVKNNRARAFQGDYAGKQGSMDGVDGDDGILKVQ
jgi:hypothetical protein